MVGLHIVSPSGESCQSWESCHPVEMTSYGPAIRPLRCGRHRGRPSRSIARCEEGEEAARPEVGPYRIRANGGKGRALRLNCPQMSTNPNCPQMETLKEMSSRKGRRREGEFPRGTGIEECLDCSMNHGRTSPALAQFKNAQAETPRVRVVLQWFRTPSRRA